MLWVMFVVSAWLIIKKLKPEWIGLSKDLNEQIIDGVNTQPGDSYHSVTLRSDSLKLAGALTVGHLGI